MKNSLHRTFCPEQLIEKAVTENWLRSLAFFVKLKSSCSHGGFPSIETAMERTGESRSAVYRYTRTLKKKGLLTKQPNGWFKLVTRKELNTVYRIKCCTVLHETKESITDITHTLRLKLIEEKDRQQQYRIKQLKLIDSCNKGSLEAVRRIVREHGSFETYYSRRLDKVKYKELLHNTGFTYSYLGEELNCSPATIQSTLTKAKEKGWCATKLLTETLCNMSLKEYNNTKGKIRKEYPSAFWEGNKLKYKVCTLYKQANYWERDVTTNSIEKRGGNVLHEV